jgi:hypothetical protein
LSSRAPSQLSSSWICFVTSACDTCISRAAAEKLPAPTTFVKAAMLAIRSMRASRDLSRSVINHMTDRRLIAAVWDPNAQTIVIAGLIRAGADPNAIDKSGVAPLHRRRMWIAM